MTNQNVLKSILTWLPAITLIPFYVLNALDKLLEPNQTGKIVESSAVMITAGIYILASTALFLYNKTIILGTFMLSLYMIAIISIHIYREKPAEIIILILIATIFATYIRKPNWFNQ